MRSNWALLFMRILLNGLKFFDLEALRILRNRMSHLRPLNSLPGRAVVEVVVDTVVVVVVVGLVLKRSKGRASRHRVKRLGFFGPPKIIEVIGLGVVVVTSSAAEVDS